MARRRPPQQCEPSADEIARERERLPPPPNPHLDPRGNTYVTDAERALERRRLARIGDLAARWLATYWQPLDCESLQLAASAGLVAGWQLERAASMIYGPMADLLAAQAADRMELRVKPLRGQSESIADLRKRERQVARSGHSVRLASLARSLLAELDRYEQASAKLVQRLQAHAAPERRNPVTKIRNEELRQAAIAVSSWTRARHRDGQGRLDGKTLWRDVDLCLEWYGHDLHHVAEENRANTLRLLVQRPRR